MTLDYLKKALEDGNEIFFDYNDQRGGVLIKVKNSIFTFTVFFGDTELECNDFEEMSKVKFFDGKSVEDLLDIIEIDFV